MAQDANNGQAEESRLISLPYEGVHNRFNDGTYHATIEDVEDLQNLARSKSYEELKQPSTGASKCLWDSVDSILRQRDHHVFSNVAGLTALHVAAEFGRFEVVRELLPKRSTTEDFEEETASGKTALHMAAISGHDRIVRWLIENYPSYEGHHLERFVNRRDQCTKPTENLRSSQLKVIPSRLNSSTASPTFMRQFTRRNFELPASIPNEVLSNTHRTALHYACEHSHTEVVKTLLAIHEVDINAKDSEGFNPLHLAIRSANLQNSRSRGGVDRLAAIRELLADPIIDVNAEAGQEGDTPLHIAVRMEDAEVVEMLCKQRMLVATKRNKHKKTPLRLAWDHEPRSDATDCIKDLLLKRPDVQRSMEELKDDKELLHTGVNALLVGGTLLASLTFAGILEMPVLPEEQDFAPYDGRKRFYERAIDIFRGSNNMCFFLSIITAMLAIQVPISKRHLGVRSFVEHEVENLRVWILFISFSLTLSTSCAVMAFVSGGLAKVPISESGWSRLLCRWSKGESLPPYKSTMIMTSIVGVSALILILGYNLCTDYFFIVRDLILEIIRNSIYPKLPSFLALVFSIVLLTSVLAVVIFLSVGVGLLQNPM